MAWKLEIVHSTVSEINSQQQEDEKARSIKHHPRLVTLPQTTVLLPTTASIDQDQAFA